MKKNRVLFRNLSFFWRTNLAVIAGVSTSVAVFAGALLVGESVRNSLRDLVLQRLGNTDYVVSADRFFREKLVDEMASHPQFDVNFSKACPVIFLRGVLINQKSGLRAHNVNVYGVDKRFWKFHGREGVEALVGRDAYLAQNLAQELSVEIEDTILLRIGTDAGAPKESLFGRREDAGRTIRLIAHKFLSAGELGEFSLQPGQGTVSSIFVPLKRLQRDLEHSSGVNAILLSSSDREDRQESLRRILRESFALEDLGLRLRPLNARNILSVESSRILLEDYLVTAASQVAEELGMRGSTVFTYLANSIRTEKGSIPYSVITAADLLGGSLNNIRVLRGSVSVSTPSDAAESIWLNEWAWRDLQPSIGDTIAIDYYVWHDEGRLTTETTELRLAGVLTMAGDVADPTLAPEVRGITKAGSISDWDPPFPVDLKLIRPKDEEYWDLYRTTPKAFVALSKGQALWKTRFGKVSSLRLTPQRGKDLGESVRAYQAKLRSRLDPEQSGFVVSSVKASGLEAAKGSTNFGEYFFYFSFFLIIAAVLLTALFFRLGVEQRAREIGILSASGFTNSAIRNQFLGEGMLLSVVGGVLGIVGSIVYAWLLLLGLRTVWVGAVGTRQLFLHASWMPLVIGAIGGALAALLSIALTLRGLRKNSPRVLLSGALESFPGMKRRTRTLWTILLASYTLAFLLLAGAVSKIIPDDSGFFGAGSLLLIGLLSSVALIFRTGNMKLVVGRGWQGILRLGARNASYRPGRAVLCIALIASATFVIVSVEAFRHDPNKVSMALDSGTGGFPLIAESDISILHDLNRPEGKEGVNLSPQEVSSLDGVTFTQFRLRPGEDASCLNLYAPREPRILGVPTTLLTSGRFSFQQSLAVTAEEKSNPWLLLESELDGGAVPAVGDANTIQYILHSGLGNELILPLGSGEPLSLRIVGTLRDSIFQGELLISERNFLRLFPEQQGSRFFLVDVPQEKADRVTRTLEQGLGDYGVDVTTTRERLAAFHRVENTYLSTFQSLGGLGLVLGTVGLATILLRNVLERRHELALLRAVGFRRKNLVVLVVAENAVLLVIGLLSGTLSALLAVSPALISRGWKVPLDTLGLTLAAVLVVGVGASVLASIAAFRSPLLPGLQSE